MGRPVALGAYRSISASNCSLTAAGKPGDLDRVALQLHQVDNPQPGRLLRRDEVVGHVTTEIRRVVGVHRDPDAELEQPLDLRRLQVAGHHRLEIGHTVRPSPRRLSSAVSDSLSRMFTPWSIRSTPMTSRHWRMCSTEFSWSASQCMVI